MNKLLLSTATAILLSSCGNETYTCSCKDKAQNDKEVANYKIEAGKKSTAAFECKQKGLAYGGNPEYKDVKCVVE